MCVCVLFGTPDARYQSCSMSVFKKLLILSQLAVLLFFLSLMPVCSFVATLTSDLRLQEQHKVIFHSDLSNPQDNSYHAVQTMQLGNL